MRLTSIFALSIGAAAEWRDLVGMQNASDLVRTLDGSPEALMVGGGLLIVASLLRLRSTGHAK